MFRRLKNTFIYVFARIATFLVGSIPRKWIFLTGRLLGTLASTVAWREKKTAERQLSAALGLGEKKRRLRILLRGVFRELATSAVELCRLHRDGDQAPEVYLSASSQTALAEALAEKRGVIFVTGHIGNWELMALTLARLGYPISTIAKESYDSRFTALIERFRQSAGVQSIYRGRPGSSAKILRALSHNRILGVLIDQDTKVPSAFVSFFGQLASTPVGAAALAARTQSAVVVGTIHRSRSRRHIIAVERVVLPENTVEATALLTSHLEKRIRTHPAQWVWFHQRWKTTPEIEGTS